MNHSKMIKEIMARTIPELANGLGMGHLLKKRANTKYNKLKSSEIVGRLLF